MPSPCMAPVRRVGCEWCIENWKLDVALAHRALQTHRIAPRCRDISVNVREPSVLSTRARLLPSLPIDSDVVQPCHFEKRWTSLVGTGDGPASGHV
jgi:hypothetical protein